MKRVTENIKSNEILSSEEEENDDDDDDDDENMDEKDEDNSDDQVDEEDDDDDDDDEDSDDDEGNEQQQKGYTDENASWLKLKKANKNSKKHQLLDDDDEEEEEEEEEDNDDDDVDEDELLDIERESRLVDDEEINEMEEADIELRRTIKDHTAVYHLPTTLELEQMIHNTDRVIPPSELKSHISSILEVLAEFKVRRESIHRSRSEYIHVLTVFVAELYGYLPELVEYFMTMFPPTECIEFIKASDQTRPLVIRTNTIKTRRKDLATALIKRGVVLDPLGTWSKVGLKIIESTVPIGATPEYLSGQYMLQSAASLCPVLALNPQPNEFVLDMSSAPGGKTSYIAQLMRNTGTIVANDLKPERQKATIANLHRLGVKNVIACAYDGRHIGTKVFVGGNRFDRILLDAPCSGLGIISRDPSVKLQRTITEIKQCAHLQKELLLAAIDALKYKNPTTKNNPATSSKGSGVGVGDTSSCCMVYSTCSVSIYENEDVIQYALSKRDIQIIDTGMTFGIDGYTKYNHIRYHPSMKLCKRYYPHTYNMDGFFICKIKKLSNKKKDHAETDTADSVAVDTNDTPDESMITTKDNDAIINRHETTTVPNPKKNKVSPVIHSNSPSTVVVGGSSSTNSQKNHSKKRKKSNDHTTPSTTTAGANAHAKTKKKQPLNAKMTKPRRLKNKADVDQV